MLIKILGAALIVSGLGGWGLYGARRLRERARHLQELSMAFGYLEKEITCIYQPPPPWPWPIPQDSRRSRWPSSFR